MTRTTDAASVLEERANTIEALAAQVKARDREIDGLKARVQELGPASREAADGRDTIEALQTKLESAERELELARRDASDARSAQRRLAEQVAHDEKTVLRASAIVASLKGTGLEG